MKKTAEIELLLLLLLLMCYDSKKLKLLLLLLPKIKPTTFLFSILKDFPRPLKKESNKKIEKNPELL